jgi:lysophospholipase L1-like esterase
MPDIVTLWWGMNDLGGCPGVFNRETNTLRQVQLNALINEHIYYLRSQIESILDQGAIAFVMTPIPVLGGLPWSHFTADYQLVWENDRHCDFNPALEQLVEAQRTLVSIYTLENKPVYLVDAWQVYKDNPFADKMYMDVVHPASHGVELIAAEWLRVFDALENR